MEESSSAAQANNVLIVPDDPLSVSVEGSPLVFASPAKVERTAQWRSAGTACGLFGNFFCSSTIDQLETYMVTVSSDLKADWDVEIIERTSLGGGFVFTPTGSSYFTTVIPELIRILPNFYSETVRVPGADREDRTFSTAEADDRESFLDNTSLDNFFQVIFEDTFNIPKTLAMTIALLIIALVVATGVRAYTGQEIAGIIGFIPVVVLGAYMGMTLIQFVTLLAAAGVVMIVWTLFFKRTD